MAKYHINPETGNVSQCKALIKCRFGGREDHYGSSQEARQAFEQHQAEALQTEKNERQKKLEQKVYQAKGILIRLVQSDKNYNAKHGSNYATIDQVVSTSPLARRNEAALAIIAGFSALEGGRSHSYGQKHVPLTSFELRETLEELERLDRRQPLSTATDLHQKLNQFFHDFDSPNPAILSDLLACEVKANAIHNALMDFGVTPPTERRRVYNPYNVFGAADGTIDDTGAVY